MSAQPFTWNLTPTERRIAEVAFGARGIDHAVYMVANLRGHWGAASPHYCNGMLAELRREPVHLPHHVSEGEHSDVLRALVATREQADRYRKLLERLVACDNVSASVGAIKAIIADARKELVSR